MCLTSVEDERFQTDVALFVKSKISWHKAPQNQSKENLTHCSITPAEGDNVVFMN